MISLLQSEMWSVTLAHCYLTLNDAKAIASATSRSSAIVATGVSGTGSGRVEAAIGPRPNPALPIVADGQVAGLARSQSEAVCPWTCSGLGCYPGVYGLFAMV